MDNMIAKKVYLWQLADFLFLHHMKMSADELAAHLNRNNFLTQYDSEYEGGRGTYTLIRETWNWLSGEIGLPGEAEKIAKAYVKPDGTYAYE